jgi:excisionase family DNA binding protein
MENLLNKKQVAELLNISVKTLDLWVSKGTGPRYLKIGRMVRFTPAEVENFIQQLTEDK